MSLAVGLPLMMAARALGPSWHWQRFHHLAHGLLPLAACGVILGLSAQTVGLLRADGFMLLWADETKLTALVLAAVWSLHLIWRISGRYRAGAHHVIAAGFGTTAIGAGALPWLLLFWIR